ncbi:hypothetical protein IGI04_012449 [Brassica rapa subsp. trilocularis]|uniref:Uncharacterized protein n=1 Tax=Brassica rapa subsp. trilocularis TaxID=1813537 RepID=A0ABQ7N8B3_BRACM|nr:hypothetical protein IGI04_012449 [Brassica rapa subsp. trilocularis]
MLESIRLHYYLSSPFNIAVYASQNLRKGEKLILSSVLIPKILDDLIISLLFRENRTRFYTGLGHNLICTWKLHRFDNGQSKESLMLLEHTADILKFQDAQICTRLLVIRFIPQTTIDEVIDNAPVINLQTFILRRFDQLQALRNIDLELPVQGSDLKDAEAMPRVVVRFIVEPTVVVYLCLWDDAAEMFKGLINQVIEPSLSWWSVVTTVNPKIFGGNLYINSTPAAKFYFDTNLPAIAEFTARKSSLRSFPLYRYQGWDKKKELVSIRDLNKFISNSDEQTQEADFICKARVVEVLQQNGWSFFSCTGCSRKLDKSGSQDF